MSVRIESILHHLTSKFTQHPVEFLGAMVPAHLRMLESLHQLSNSWRKRSTMGRFTELGASMVAVEMAGDDGMMQ